MGLTRITSDGITDGTVVNADINASAAIAGSKISPDFTGQVIKGQQLEITHHTPQIKLIDNNNNSDFDVMNQNGVFKVYDRTNLAGRLHIASDGTTDIFQNLNVGAGLDVTGAITATDNITITSSHPKLLLTDDTNPDFSVHVNASAFHIRNETDTRNDFRITSDGTNELYHGGNLKLKTVSGGIDVTGSITSTGNLNCGDIVLTDQSPSITFTDSDNNPDYALITNAGNFKIHDSTNAVTRLLIDSSGQVGIGITPNEKLVVDGNSSVTGALFITSNTSTPSAAAFLYRPASNTLALGSNSTERMRITSDGKVGINETNPQARLHVGGDLFFTGGCNIEGGSSASNLTISGGSTFKGGRIILGGGNGDDDIRFSTSGASTSNAERMRIDSSGRLLLGTTTASAFTDRLLTVASSGGAGIEMRAGTSSISQLSFSDGSGNDTSGYRGFISYQHASDLMQIGVAASARVNIDSSGNVGIKTSSAIGTLDVHDGTFVLSKPSTNSASRNWRFLPDNIAAGNLGLQVSTAAGGSTFQNVLEVDKTGTIFTAQNGTAFSWPSNPGHVWYADGEARSTTANGVHYRINRMNGDGHAVQFYRGQTNMVGFISITSSSTGYGSGSSDERTKKNIEVWNEDILSKFKGLSPKTFNFNWEEDGTTKHKGYIAQNELDKFPEAYPKNNLSDSGDEFYTFVPTDMTVYLMKGLKEAAEKIETLEAKVAALETK